MRLSQIHNRTIKNLMIWAGISILTSILFYDTLIVAIVLFLAFPIFHKRQKVKEEQKSKEELGRTFKDALMSLSSALEAGYSIENAIREVIKDLCLIYPADAGIIKEFQYMSNQIHHNIPVEDVFRGFAERTNLEDIHNFSEILITAKRTGGDLVKIIKKTSGAISEKSEVMQEIKTSMSGKKYESMIMKMVPYMILLYFRLLSSDYLEPLYGNPQGVFIMSVLLVLYVCGNYLVEKIMAIEI